MSQTPYLVQFFDSLGNNSGLTGAWLGGAYVLTSASQAAAASLTASFVAKIGGVLQSGLDAAQTSVIVGVDTDPNYMTPGDGSDLCIVTLSGGGFTPSARAAPIPYSPAFNTTPYSGEYFYPPGAALGDQGWEEYVGGAFSTTVANEMGGNYTLTSNADASFQYGFTVPDGEMVIDTGGDIFQNGGSPLICGGYGGYFLVGICNLVDSGGFNLSRYTRLSYNVAWVQSFTGIDPIVYP